jgi:hypothetical protein
MIGCGAAIAAFALSSEISHADEGGVSFWLPGQYGSMTAVPQTPGWALGAIYYHTSLSAGGDVAAAKEIQIRRFSPTVNVKLKLNLSAQGDLVVLAPSYTFATPVFGGQLAVSVASIYGRSAGSLAGTLTVGAGSLVATRMGTLDDSLNAFGELYPTMTLRWNQGVNNFMTYVSGEIPIGAYDPTRLANLGIGHGAIDAGGGYTYFNPATGNEFSSVAGFTYNFKNQGTQYQNGIDSHFDWSASHFLSKQIFAGLVGYPVNYMAHVADSQRFYCRARCSQNKRSRVDSQKRRSPVPFRIASRARKRESRGRVGANAGAFLPNEALSTPQGTSVSLRRSNS